MQYEPRGSKDEPPIPLTPSLGDGTQDFHNFTANPSQESHESIPEQSLLDGRPMLEYLDEFARLVLANDVVILDAETGAGKSTLAPAHLLKFFDKVICTQPRRLLAHALGAFVAKELGVEYGKDVGVMTAQVKEASAKDTKLLFCTDGWAAQFLMSQNKKDDNPHKDKSTSKVWWKKGQPDALVIDEAHEQNLAQELLLAHWREQYIRWSQGTISDGVPVPKPPKLILMSATLGIEKLLRFFIESCGVKDGSIDLLKVPGRQFPIEDRFKPNLFIPDEILKTSEEGRETLIFEKGKGEIEDLCDGIHVTGAPTVVLPLYRDLTRERQEACFRKYFLPRTIVSTNIAESGATPDVDEVISTGYMKALMPNERGGYCLSILECPQFNLTQQRGRVGRTKPGVWTLAGGSPFEKRDEMLPPELRRAPLEGMMLNIIKGGFNPENLSFLNGDSKTSERMKVAVLNLKSFGYLTYTNQGLQLTKKGEKFKPYPVRFELNVFLNELHEVAEKEELKNPNLAKDLVRWGLVIAAVVEVGRIHKRCGDEPTREPWFRFGEIANITTNDIFAHTTLFAKVYNMASLLAKESQQEISPRQSFERKLESEFAKLHIDPRKYQQVLDMLDMMTKGNLDKFLPIPERMPQNGTETRIVDALIKAFKNNIYEVIPQPKEPKKTDKNIRYFQKPIPQICVRHSGSRDDSEPFQVVRSTLIKTPTNNDCIIGLPFSLEKDTGEVVHLVQFPMIISRQRIRGVLGWGSRCCKYKIDRSDKTKNKLI
jgi:HrpA-like RNA helicase